jgi:lipid II:glycine glycyltransferase (peptidoglycan interpeptide bridge formation enzyme)
MTFNHENALNLSRYHCVVSSRITSTVISDPLEWNTLVTSFSHYSALQGWGFGEVRRVSGWTPHRLKLERDGVTFAAAQVLRRKQTGLSFLYCPRGPAMNSVNDLEDVAVALKAWAGAGDVSLKIEPPIPLPSDGTGSNIPEFYGVWKNSSTIQPEHTILLDLTKPEDEFFKNMHDMARRNTRTSLKLGVTAQLEDDFESFWGLFSETNTRSSLLQRQKTYYEAVWRECNKFGGEAAIITARYEGKPLASGLIIGLGHDLNYLYGGSTRLERKEGEKDPKASNGFYWGMIQHGMKRGYKYLDLFGIPKTISEDKHSFGVYEFKERLGGQKVFFPAYELSLSPISSLMNTAFRLRKNYLNYRARGTTKDVL